MRIPVTAVLVAALSFVVSSHRFGDSAHAMGMVSIRGGKVRHGAHLKQGWSRYTVVVTATVLPPFRGDVVVEFEGEPKLRRRFASPEPIVDLHLRRHPEFRANCFFDVNPGDRLVVWASILEAPDGVEEYSLVFRDRRTGGQVLRIPVEFHAVEGGVR